MLFIAGCGGGSSSGSEDLETYLSKIELYRTCNDYDQGYHDEMWLNETGDGVSLWTVDEKEDFIDANYEYGLEIDSDSVTLTNDAGEENGCAVIKKENATQFKCNRTGASIWYHTLSEAKKHPQENCDIF